MLFRSWAYAEGIFDLRRLLAGGKVSLVKNEANWHLSIEQLPLFLSSKGSGGTDDEAGLTYGQYLRILLAVRSDRELTEGLMDLVEDTVRRSEGKDAFRIDNCIDAIQMELSSSVEGKKLTAFEQYGYGMT